MVDYRSYTRNLSSREINAWKLRPEGDSNPWTLRYLCSVLPTELSSHLGAGYIVCRVVRSLKNILICDIFICARVKVVSFCERNETIFLTLYCLRMGLGTEFKRCEYREDFYDFFCAKFVSKDRLIKLNSLWSPLLCKVWLTTSTSFQTAQTCFNKLWLRGIAMIFSESWFVLEVYQFEILKQFLWKWLSSFIAANVNSQLSWSVSNGIFSYSDICRFEENCCSRY